MDERMRLACVECDNEEFADTTVEGLRQAIESGWQGVQRVQSLAEAVATYDDPFSAPAGFSALDWWTHLGWCPHCAED